MASQQPGQISASPAQTAIIRFALFMGVFMFGIVTWYIRSQEPPPSDSGEFAVLNYVFLALVAVAVSIAVVMKRKQTATPEWGKRVTYGIIGWAACESTALFGGVYWLLTGDSQLYMIGVVILVASLLLLAPRQPETAV
jgi:hypothetical protein